MTSSTSASQRVISGPRFRYRPPHVTTHGDIAARVGADLGWDMDPEQRWLLDAIYAEDGDGLPASGEVCIVGPRQTVGKSAALAVAAITDITVFDIPLHVWTAHEFKTSRKAYLDMRQRLDAHPDYKDRVSYRDAHGEESISFELGGAIEFHARSGGSGRGFTTARITLDEALFVRAGDLGALAPTMVTMPDAQVRYGSSAGKPGSEMLRGLRDRGRNPEPGETLAYVEFGAERRPCAQDPCAHALGAQGCALEDRDLWWQANSGLWYGRVGFEAMVKQRRMFAAAPAEFVREFYSWWEDPAGVAGGAFDVEAWAGFGDPGVERGPGPAFGVATAPDRTWAAVAVAWKRPDGLMQVMLTKDEQGRVDYRPTATWVKARATQLRGRWGGRVGVNKAARGLLGADVAEHLSVDELAQAENKLSDLITAGAVRHGNDPSLDTAVRGARWKDSAGTRVIDESGDVEVSPVVAASIAVWLADQGSEPWAFYDD